MSIHIGHKLDEDQLAQIIAWPRFICIASILFIFAIGLWLVSIVVGQGLRLSHYLLRYTQRFVHARSRKHLVSLK
jgi:hypothetical protein